MVKIQNRRYLGNKYKLTEFIHDTVEQDCGKVDSVFDVFAGTGVVAYSYMTQAQVVVNDILYSNHLFHRAFMSKEAYDDSKVRELLAYYNEQQPEEDNYMSQTFGNTYFSMADCRKIGFIREDIEQRFASDELNRRERAILVTSLLYGMDKIAKTCGHYDAYRKGAEFDKPLVLDMLDLSETAKDEPVLFHGNSNELIKLNGFPAVDLAYCDPPYNSRNYSDTYHILENVAAWKKPPVYGVARKMDRTELKSQYCTRSASAAFADLVDNLQCKYIVLSYNNTGKKANDRSNARMSDDDIMAILDKKGDVLVREMDYKAFTTGKSDNHSNVERLFVCRVRQ